MEMSLSSVFIFLLGILPSVLAGNQCSTQFPGKGYCIGSNQYCPSGTQEYRQLSNGLGCPTMSSRCCIALVQTNPTSVSANDRTQCGLGSLNFWLKSRIFNGIKSAPCDWPFVVSIRSLKKTSSRLDYFGTKHLCAGVLIGNQWVLTSAVCILNAAGTIPSEARNKALVVAGEFNISGIDIYPNTGGQQEQVINIERAILHPKYAYSHYSQIDLNNPKQINSNGIGLIKLAQPIAGRCSGVICLPNQQEARNECANYENCVITGWGFTSESYTTPQADLDILKQSKVRIASRKGCKVVETRLGLSSVRPEGSLCQHPDLLQTDSCMGDEGGAVMCSVNNNWVVRAILPFNVMCRAGKSTFFATDVSLYLDWIQSTMNYYGRTTG